SDLHPVECRFDLVVTAAARDPLEWQERKAPKTPRAADRDDEEPACEVRIVRRRMAKSGDEGVVQRVERALAVAQYREKRSIDARELEAVELGPALCGHHGPPCNATGGPFSLVRALRRYAGTFASSLRTTFVASTTATHFSTHSSTVRVLSPQSGCGQRFSARTYRRPLRIPSAATSTVSVSCACTSTIPIASSFVKGLRSNKSSQR